MSIPTGTHTFGPDTAKLTVSTGRKGAAAKAGHDLVIEVTSWNATVEIGDDGAAKTIALAADSASMRVLEGTGGIQALGDKEKDAIRQTINDEVLKGATIEFRSSAVEPKPDAGRLGVQGELELLGARRPIAFELLVSEDGRLTGEATVKQTEWGMKPYSALFGTLKVADEVRVAFDGRVPSS
jgi:polyisoprenoid-binding protein YceI